MAETKTSPQQVSWSDKKIKLEKKMKSMKVGSVFWQSGGRSMSKKRSEKIGKETEVYITCGGKVQFKGEILVPFKPYDEIKNDENDYIVDLKEKEARHANKLYCKIRVLEIYTEEQKKKFGKVRGNQNTFCTPSKAFWKII